MKKIDWKKLGIALIVPQLVGGLGAFATATNVGSWYSLLEKPFFNPPNWLFGPVWTVLYICMGVAWYLVWVQVKNTHEKKVALQFFTIQLILNFAWTFIFFGVNEIGLALLEILTLWVTILITTVYFLRLYPIAGYLFIPYLAWVSFASVLNAALWKLNM